LNALNGFVATPEQLKVFPFAAEAVRLINRSGARAVLATNQPVVARGECTSAGLAKVHAKLETVLGQGGAYLDRIYYCPHHPDAGFPGEIAELKVACDCRKPKPGLLLAARDELNIDLSQSWMMGDRAADQMAARACGVAFVLIRAGQADAALEASSDFAFDDLRQAAVFITQAYPRIAERLETVVETSEAGGEWFIAGGGGSEKTLASVLARELRGLGHVTTIVALDASSPQSLPTAGHAAASMDIKEALLTYHRERRRLSGEQAADWKTIILWAGDAALAVARAAGVLDRCILLEGAQGGEELTLRDEGRPGAIPFIISLEGCFEAPVAP
jgi:D,D-heptose 1,7-bisphosphate phosphatase